MCFIMGIGYAQTNTFTADLEFCYEYDSETFNSEIKRSVDDIFIAASIQYTALRTQPEFLTISAKPSIIYNAAEGVDLQLQLWFDLLWLNSNSAFQIIQGPRFPIAFLSACTIYIKVNIGEQLVGGF